MKKWLAAARPQTLPLAASSIILANCIAYADDTFRWKVAIFTLLTAIALQVLSNFANDYGDAIKGADNHLRTGPERMVSSGQISKEQMFRAVFISASLSLVFGILLLIFSKNIIS